MAIVTYNNQIENRFWLEIMGDNVRIILSAFHPDDSDEITAAHKLITQFDNLLNRASQNLASDQLNQLNQDAFSATQGIRQFFLRILDLQVTQAFFIFLKPSIINNMVDLSNEYLRILYAFTHNRLPDFDPIDQDTFWLQIFIAQSIYIADNVGTYDAEIRREVYKYGSLFKDLLNAALDLKGIVRIGKRNFPIEVKHRKNMEKTLRNYADFIAGVMLTVQKNQMPGSLSLEYMDRANRILCYYLKQLAVLSDTQQPECDPTSPRLSIR